MKPYKEFEINSIFNRLWDEWPNQTGEATSLKAFRVFLNQGGDLSKLEKGIKCYLIDNHNLDPNYIKNLGNFIREDSYLDYSEKEDKLLKREQDAQEVLKAWNDRCRKHWHQALGEARLSLALKALSDKSFAKNWKKALDIIHGIFKYPLRENDPLSKTKLTFRWFCSIDAEKHTVLRAIEGEFGYPEKEVIIIQKPVKEVDEAARKKASEYLKGMFPDMKFERKKERETKPSKQAQQLANEILKGIAPFTEELSSEGEGDGETLPF